MSMDESIRSGLSEPASLENLYRQDPRGFHQAFRRLWPEIGRDTVAQVWFERLRHDQFPSSDEEIKWGRSNDLWFALGAGLLSGFLILLPEYIKIGGLEMDEYISRNIGLFTLPFLALWFWRKREIPLSRAWFVPLIIVLLAVFLNLFPGEITDEGSLPDTLFLALLHSALLLWSMVGYVFSGGRLAANPLRVEYLRFNGELLIMLAVLSSAWGATAGLTMGLFSLIGINLGDYHFERVLIQGMALLPLLGTFVLGANPQLVNRVSPLVARIFSPIVLVILSVYLVAMLATGKDPYSDREFLLNFNLLLIGVMALILFAVSGLAGYQQSKFNRLVLLLLAGVTVVVNLVALSAIIYRIGTWGITPNRLAVMGGNGLILVHLVWITVELYRSHVRGTDGHSVEEAISRYLPVYTVWTVIVTFLFPLLFSFR